MEGQRRSKEARMTSTDDDDGRTDKRMTTRLQERRHREETLRLLRDVLNNHVVCDNIASFLSLSDMKAASQVSRQFLQAIRGTRRFAQTVVLAITDENLEDMKLFLTQADCKWRGVKLDVTDPTNLLEDLPRVMKSAEFVSLEGRPWVIEDWEVMDAIAVRLLTAVFSSTPKLSQLTIDIRFLPSDVGSVLSSPAVQQTLRNLSRLDLVNMTEITFHWTSLVYRYFDSEEEDTFWRNFGVLTGLPNRLKCFKLAEANHIQKVIIGSLHRSVLRLLRNNRATLEELELHLSVWQIKELQTLTFPALKALTASIDNLSDRGTLGKFLKNQRSLEELTLTSWVEPGAHVYTGIKECSVGLKKLYLTGQCFEEFDWSFLASMNRLKDFRLKTCEGFENGVRLLASLPKNQLDCLSLEELRDLWGRRRGFFGVENVFHLKTELLQGFRCLRKLSFLGSWNSVDDQLMQWLLKEFVTLEELQISKCFTLTDAGITGKTTAEWGRDASFADLHRLKTLKIVRCRGVTPNGVLASCLNVPSLESLEYSNPPGPIEESVVLQLVEQNPRLVRLTLEYRGDVDGLGKLKAKLKKKNPRVKLSKAEEEDDE